MPVITLRPREARALAPALVAATNGTTPRMNAKRGHDDRAEARARGGRGGVQDRIAMDQAPFAGHLHDQDGVLRAECDQQNEADLGIKIVGDTESGQRGGSARQGKRHGQWHAQRRDPAFASARRGTDKQATIQIRST